MKDKLKIFLLGDSEPGKTCLFKRYVYNKYKKNHLVTIGIDFKTCDFDFLGKKIKIQLWDTAGQERFANKEFLKPSDIIILVYSVDDRRSFEKIKSFWLPKIKEGCDENGK